jgi:hypothetical protein
MTGIGDVLRMTVHALSQGPHHIVVLVTSLSTHMVEIGGQMSHLI